MTRKKKDFDRTIKNRFLFLTIMIVIFFVVIFVKIADVMLVEEDKYEISLENLTDNKFEGTSSPRGRIYDRNYNIIVDNKSLKTIIYQKPNKTTNLEMIEIANKFAPHIELDYSRITMRNRKEYYCAKNESECNQLITNKEREKVKQRKLTSDDIYELKIERVPEENVQMEEQELKVAYIY